MEGFDVITMRMTVEHVLHPARFVESLRRMCAPGARVVVYTVNRWAPVSILARLVPFAFHHHIASLLWGRAEGDSFPVEYRMNTRRELSMLMGVADFAERHFEYLDDCRTFARFRVTSLAELLLWKGLNAMGRHYPETCLLAVYQLAEE
jgi:SAM-dependent methyltransferase